MKFESDLQVLKAQRQSSCHVTQLSSVVTQATYDIHAHSECPLSSSDLWFHNEQGRDQSGMLVSVVEEKLMHARTIFHQLLSELSKYHRPSACELKLCIFFPFEGHIFRVGDSVTIVILQTFLSLCTGIRLVPLIQLVELWGGVCFGMTCVLAFTPVE